MPGTQTAPPAVTPEGPLELSPLRGLNPQPHHSTEDGTNMIMQLDHNEPHTPGRDAVQPSTAGAGRLSNRRLSSGRPTKVASSWNNLFDPAISQTDPRWPRTATAINLLQAIEARARGRCYAFMGNDDLVAKSGGKKLRMCQYALKELERCGWVKIVHEGPAKCYRLGMVMLRRASNAGHPAADTPERLAEASWIQVS